MSAEHSHPVVVSSRELLPARLNDRRQAARHEVHPARDRVRLRLGHEVSVLNVSRDGILIEGNARLLPGNRVEFQLDGLSMYIPAVIARCEVSMLDEQGVTYRAGLAFAQPLHFQWE